MSATETTHETDSDETAPVPGPKRLQPHQIAVVIGIAIAAIVVVSGIAATTLAGLKLAAEGSGQGQGVGAERMH